MHFRCSGLRMRFFLFLRFIFFPSFSDTIFLPAQSIIVNLSRKDSYRFVNRNSSCCNRMITVIRNSDAEIGKKKPLELVGSELLKQPLLWFSWRCRTCRSYLPKKTTKTQPTFHPRNLANVRTFATWVNTEVIGMQLLPAIVDLYLAYLASRSSRLQPGYHRVQVRFRARASTPLIVTNSLYIRWPIMRDQKA